jgi:ribosome-associated protein
MTDSKKEPRAGRRAPRASAPRAASRKVPRQPARATRSPGAEDARKLALVIATAALEKKALAIEILDVVGKVDYADFLVLMTGRSNRQVDALSQAVEEACEMKKRRALSIEGTGAASWILIDFGDVVVHIFQEEARGMYDIEGLWLDAQRLPVPGQSSEER